MARSRLIDEKGRLFGKLNIVDVIAVLIVLLVIVAGLKFLYSEDEKQWTTMDIVAREQVVTDKLFVGKTIEKGDSVVAEVLSVTVVPSERAETGLGSTKNIYLTLRILASRDNKELYFMGQQIKLNSEIELAFQDIVFEEAVVTGINTSRYDVNRSVSINLGVVDQSTIRKLEDGTEFKDFSGSYQGRVLDLEVIPQGDSGKQVIVHAELACERIGNRIYYQKQLLRINNELYLSADDLELKGTIIDTDYEKAKEEVVNVLVVAAGLEPYVAEAISVGDTETGYNSRVLAEIVDVEISPSEMVVIAESGEVLRQENPVLKDAILEVEVTAELVEKSYMFHQSELKVGNSFRFDSPRYSIRGEIVQVR